MTCPPANAVEKSLVKQGFFLAQTRSNEKAVPTRNIFTVRLSHLANDAPHANACKATVLNGMERIPTLTEWLRRRERELNRAERQWKRFLTPTVEITSASSTEIVSPVYSSVI